MTSPRFGLAFCAWLFVFATGQAQQRVEFHRMVAHWDAYGKPEYLDFIKEARPEVAQVGFYGAHYWSLAHTQAGKGYPAHFPVVGLNECGDWFTTLNKELHKHNVKVVGHFNVEFLVGDPESKDGPRGFFKFYRELWDEKLLGPRPVADPLTLLELDADGKPRTSTNYSIGGMKEYWGCLNNPNWRKVLKAWAKVGIERGVDGYISNYFYRHDCLCEHCQAGFRDYLSNRYKPEELREEFRIVDLAKHKFTEIGGWHDPKQSTLLKREMLRFSQVSIKAAYDDVFVKYGRSLKPDLILAQWNHLGNFNQINGDERCLLPIELWGKGEDYTWYSTGGAACYTDLESGYLGEGTLQARFIRGIFENKPFTLGKYEGTRIRVAISELAANGGAPMGFYTRFTDPEAKQEIVRYYHFLEKHKDLYRGQKSHAEVLLLYPRSRVQIGEVFAVEQFKTLGNKLLDQHVLFDVLPDELATNEVKARYKKVLSFSDEAKLPADLSQVVGPKTVRASANRTKSGGLTVHLVNYNRIEPAQKKSAGRGIVDEKPIEVEAVQLDLLLPPGVSGKSVKLLTPEAPDGVVLPAKIEKGRLVCTVPRFLVYAVVHISSGE